MALCNFSSSRGRFIAGIILLFCVNVLWVSSSEATRVLFQSLHYEKPFFTAWFKSSLFMIYLIGFVTSSWRNQGKIDLHSVSQSQSNQSSAMTTENQSLPSITAVSDEQSEVDESSTLLAASSADLLSSSLPKLTWKQVAILSAMFSLPWFVGASLYQLALLYATAAVVNTISASSSIFTLILSAIFPVNARDNFNFTKLLATFLCISGVTSISFGSETNSNDNNSTLTINSIEINGQSSNMLLGILWAGLSALCYASYLVMVKKRVNGHEERLNLLMFFGFVGTFVFFCFWPVLVILHYTNIEIFEFPTSISALLLLLLNGLIGTLLAEWLWLWGCFLTSSLLATVALSLNTPLSLFADLVFFKASFDWKFYLGSALIFSSFLVISAMNIREHQHSHDPLRQFCQRCFKSKSKTTTDSGTTTIR